MIVSGEIKRIAIDRLKPCFKFKDEVKTNLQICETHNSKISQSLPNNDSPEDTDLRNTKTGRRVRFPA